MSTKVPPDGGWGWVIVIGYALNNLSTIPILQGFGLIFKDSLAALGLTATDTSIIINFNFAFGMIFGLINAPLLKSFGYRKVAMIGSIMFTIGITLTAFAKSFYLIMVSYGMLASLGMVMSLSGFSLAFNSYFSERRGRAMGLTMTITGLGPILMPQVTSFLLSFYGTQGTILLFGAFTLHSMIGVTLLQPIKWHMKSVPLCLETIAKSPEIINNKEDALNHNVENETNVHSSRTTLNDQRQRKISIIDHDVEVGSIYGFDVGLSRQISVDSRTNITHDANYDSEMPKTNLISMTNLQGSRKCLKYPWWNSAKSINSINLGSSIKIFEEPTLVTKKLTFVNDLSRVSKSNQSIVEEDSLLEKQTDNCSIKENCNNDNWKNKSAICRILQRVAAVYDLDLLRDPTYVNLMLGMSVAIFAEVNFSLFTPFILAEMNMTTAKIASALSIIATADLCSRSVSPFLGEWLHQPPRMMYMFSLCLLIISRTSLIFINSYGTLLIVATCLGVSKGIRSVYMTLVVPSYVPIQKLPSASAIQMLTNGIIIICAGPFFGLIRDKTGSYIPCIIMINSVTAVTITMWLVEMIFVRKKSMQ